MALGLFLGVTSVSSRRQGCLLNPVALVRLCFGVWISHLQEWDDAACSEGARKAGSWSVQVFGPPLPTVGGPYVCNSTALGRPRGWRETLWLGRNGHRHFLGSTAKTPFCYLVF